MNLQIGCLSLGLQCGLFSDGLAVMMMNKKDFKSVTMYLVKKLCWVLLAALLSFGIAKADEHQGGVNPDGYTSDVSWLRSDHDGGYAYSNYVHGVTTDYYTEDEQFAEFVQNYLEWCNYVDTYGTTYDYSETENNGFEFNGHIYLTGFSLGSMMYYNPSDVSSITVTWDTSNVDFSSGGMESYSIIVQGVLDYTNSDFPSANTPAYAKIYYNRGKFEYYVTCEGYTCYCPISVNLKFIPEDESSAYTFKAENVKTTSDFSYQINDETNLVDYTRYDEFSNMNFQGIATLTLYNSGLGNLLNGTGSFDFVCNRTTTVTVPTFPLVYPDPDSPTYENDLRTYNYITQVLDGALDESNTTQTSDLLDPLDHDLYTGMFGLLKYVVEKGRLTFSGAWYNGFYFKLDSFESRFISIPETVCDLNFDNFSETTLTFLNIARYVFAAFFIFKCVLMVWNSFNHNEEGGTE